MLMMSIKKLLFCEPFSTLRVLLMAYVMSVLRGVAAVIWGSRLVVKDNFTSCNLSTKGYLALLSPNAAYRINT